MVEIIWSIEANHWLKKIHDYIALDNVTAAKNTIRGIYKKTQTLKSFPRIGYIYENEESIRVLLYGHYRIAYSIEEKGQNINIYILGVFHGAMNIEKYL